MTKTVKGTGKLFEPIERDRRLADHCRASVTMAGSMRKSGSATQGLQLLSGALPIQVELIYRRFHGRGASLGVSYMLNELLTRKTIDDVQHKMFSDGLKAVALLDGRDISAAIQAGLEMHRILCSDAYKDAAIIRKPEKDAPSPQAKSSAWQRWAAAAASLFAIGGGANHGT